MEISEKVKNLYDAFNDKPVINVKNKKFLVNPLFDQQPETTFEQMDEALIALNLLAKDKLPFANKILGEEDRGGFLSTNFAYKNKLSFGMVKWNPNGLDGQIKVDFRMAYTEGSLYFNGIKQGDKLILIEDLIDTGGTLVSMLKALKDNNIEVIGVFAIAEIEEMNGIERVYKETGITPEVAFKVSRLSERSKILWVNDKLKTV